ncbi:MAG: helical backbone metal receptor [Bdellovibrionia bacterium]
MMKPKELVQGRGSWAQRAFFWGVWAWAVLGSSGNAWARSILDVTGTRVSVSDHPQRVVTLIPSLGELAAELLGSDSSRIVGVSAFSDTPASIQSTEQVGSYQRLNLEKIVALKPDLILGSLEGNSTDQILHLREFSLPVVMVRTSNFHEVAESIRLVALALGELKRGEIAVQKFQKGLQAVKARTTLSPPKRVLLQVGDDPLVVVGGKSFLNDAIEAVGAQNVYGDLSLGYPRPSLEDVLLRNPEVILVAALAKDRGAYVRMVEKWRRLPTLQAVQKKQVLLFESDALLRPTLRMIEGLEQLRRAIEGGHF